MNVHGYVTWGTSLSPFIFQNMSNYACLVSVACIFRRFLFSVLWVVLILIFGLLDWVSTNTIKFWLEHDLTCIFTADFLIMCFSSCLNEDVMAKEDACATSGKYFLKCWVCMEKFSSLIIFEYLYEYIFPKGSFSFFYGSWSVMSFPQENKNLTVKCKVRISSDRGFFSN